MTNEITKIELFGQNNDGDGMRFAIASSAVVVKGTLMNLSDPRTTAAATTVGEAISGIAGMGKNADHSTSITNWENGVFEAMASGAVTIGCKLYSSSDANYPNTLATTIGLANPASGAEIVGICINAVADANRFQFSRKGIGG